MDNDQLVQCAVACSHEVVETHDIVGGAEVSAEPRHVEEPRGTHDADAEIARRRLEVTAPAYTHGCELAAGSVEAAVALEVLFVCAAVARLRDEHRLDQAPPTLLSHVHHLRTTM